MGSPGSSLDVDRLGRWMDAHALPGEGEALTAVPLTGGYVVLARFKLAIVLEKSVARHARGEGDDRVATFDAIVLELMRKAEELSRTTSLP